MPIPASQARPLFTQALIDVYKERLRPTAFLRSFFPDVFVPTKYVSIEVERMGENVAVDVLRGTEGNRNTFSRSTQKIFEPLFYREFFDATNLDLYDQVLGAMGSNNVQLFAELVRQLADKLMVLEDKIERAKELQCAQVLFSNGVITLKDGTTIDYKRKSGSNVDPGSGQYFANSIDPFPLFGAGAEFIRTKGRSGDSVFNAVLGSLAITDLLNNAKFLERQNLVNMALDAVQGPVRSATGAAFHGTITAGAYKIQLWSYPQFYKHPTSGVDTPYVDPKLVTIIPTNPRFKMAHAAVPQLITEGKTPQTGPYVIGNFRDERAVADIYDIQSAPLAVPVAVDTIYTFRAKAA